MQIIDTRTTRPVEDNLFDLRALLVLAALLEGLEAVLDLPLLVDRPNLLYGPWAEAPTAALGVFFAKVRLGLHPLLAIAALTLTIVGHVRGALIALGAVSVVTWLSFLPVVIQDGLSLRGWWDMQWTLAQLFLFPLFAGVSIALATFKKWYMLAAALLTIPTGYNFLGMFLFIVHVIVAN